MTITLQPQNFSLRASGGSLDSRATDPPAFTAAPSTASIPSSGGTIQFTASNAASYSLTASRNGITINSSTGLVTVASIAQGTSGSITVRATNASSQYVETSCAVTVAAYVQSGVWQLPSGHFELTRLTPVIVAPRPDSETLSWERNRLCPDGIAWSYNLSLKGGSFPEFWELLDGPTGMFAEQVLWPWGTQRYWRLRWDNPTMVGMPTGGWPVTVRVRTQEYGRNVSGYTTELSVSFTLKVADHDNPLFFLHVDVNEGHLYTDTGTGTLGNPFKYLNDWYRTDEGLLVARGRQIFYRGGTHPFTNGAETSPGVFEMTLNQGNLSFTGVNGPLVHIGFPGEEVIFDCGNPAGATSGLNYGAKWFLTGATGLFMQNIHMTNGRQDLNNAHYFWLTGRNKEKRVTLFENTFSNMNKGLVGTDNTSVMFGSALNYLNRGQYYCTVGNLYDNLGGGSNGVSMYDLYRTELLVTEGNIVQNCRSRYGLWSKALNGNASVRNNYLWNANAPDTSPGSCIEVNSDLTTDEVPMSLTPIEVCWNIVKSNTANDTRLYTIACDVTSSSNTEINAYHVYRNTVGGNIANEGPVDVSTTVTNNLILRNPGYSTSIKNFAEAAVTGNVVLTTADLDASGFLTGAARTLYRGTHGAEVA